MQALGSEVGFSLHGLRLDDLERGDLLLRLRALASAAAEHRKAREEAEKARGGGK